MISPSLLCSLIFLLVVQAAAVAVDRLLSEEDLTGLYSLRASLGIRSRAWPRKTDPCSNWTGVACRSGRVVELNLTGLHRTRLGRLNPRFAIDGVRNLTALERFVGAGFQLPGPIPDWLGSGFSPSFSVLVLNSAAVSGYIPYSLGGATGLRVISLSANSITGNIPPTLGDIAKLSSLDLSGNLLSSSIPPELAALRNLSFLNLSSNLLSGTIPPSFGMLSELKILALAGNSLEGAVPSQLGKLSKLESLDLSSNTLAGVLPEAFFSGASNLRSVNLSRNYFIGVLPNSTWLLSELELFDVSSNNLTGVFPELVPANMTATGEVFNISSNLYYGLLSSGMWLFLHRFRAVDLSNNYLEGSEPFDIKRRNALLGSNCFHDSMNQRSLAVCENFYKERARPFEGSVPPDPSKGVPKSDTKSSHKWRYILAGVLGGCGVLIAASILFLCCLKRSKNRSTNQGESPKDRELPSSSKHLVSSPGIIGESFTYEQIAQATSDFRRMNLIKQGHSGNFYLGILKKNVSVVVKRVDVLTMRREAYLVELDLFAKDLNGKLVPFIGHCLEKENEKFLVYKFMPHGDLSMALHRQPMLEEDGLQSLDWITRLKIATGVAEALCFLHHECNPPLVHRDIQSSSILLDDKFEVRLGSLSDVCAQDGDNHPNVITRILRRSQTPEQGTSGSSATCAFDIYGLGKVMLELITGKFGISSSNDLMDTEWLDRTLPYININEKDLISKIIDPTLMVDDDLLEEVWAMAVMARCCLNPKPHKRPLARHLLKALHNPLRVVRDESFSGSGPLRSSSSHSSWIGAFLGGWLHSSSEILSVSGQLGRDQNILQAGGARSHGSLEDHSFSRTRASREVFPEPNGTSTEVDE
ncbi:probable LRR receptor-like serine/threonine-protein kinase At2g16250 [Dendrobium catenatum]|uniref:probable LRR receptor-like serine/threonine-protein kinase At2g16250 n=1 Tax=Dendrobium catenatum TaxID=906689 RepID=UPI0009F560D5|nr:probable LRR receptor-like serine/threonine-protein kinase At2g16250 [Dendrobium catenatum]